MLSLKASTIFSGLDLGRRIEYCEYTIEMLRALVRLIRPDKGVRSAVRGGLNEVQQDAIPYVRKRLGLYLRNVQTLSGSCLRVALPCVKHLGHRLDLLPVEM